MEAQYKQSDKIGLVDADLLNGGTRHPNLVLMKIAGFLHDNGVEFGLITDTNADVDAYARIYISKVFTTTPLPKFVDRGLFANPEKFIIGGTGDYANEKNVKLFKENRLRDMAALELDPYLCTLENKRGGAKTKGIDMRRQKPYYHLYDEYIQKKEEDHKDKSYYNDYKFYSIGFLTRGCIRHCPFCVNKLEGKVELYSKLEWFLDDEVDENGKLIRPFIYLWDDNFLAAPKEIWKPALQELIDSKRPFQFRQGLDERMLAESPDGEEIAQMLSKCKYHGDFIFAFDNWKDRPLIEKALKIWKKYNEKKSTKFYLFCGFMLEKGDDEKLYKDITEIFYRIRVLMQYGCFGYVMRHEDYKKHEMSNIYVQIARWCNQPKFYRYMSFWEYCYRNQSFWEQNTKKINEPDLITFEEFEEKYNSGFYVQEGMKICKTLQTFIDFLDRFKEHKDELMELFNLRLKDSIKPELWKIK